MRRTGYVTGYEYEIKVRGRLTPSLVAEFEQLHLESHVQPVETLLRGKIDDQAALHGLLRRVEALGLELVEVRRTNDAGQRISS